MRSNLASVAIDRGNLRDALGLALTAESSVVASKLTLRRRLLCLQVQCYAMLGDFESVDRVLQDVRQFDWPSGSAPSNRLYCGFCSRASRALWRSA